MAKRNGRILIIDDEHDILLTARLFLKQHFTIVQTESDPKKLTKILEDETFDVILLDMNFSIGSTSGKEGLHFLNTILARDPSVPVILMTAYGDVELAVKAIKEGAFDFVLKPWENEKLLATVLAAFQLRGTKLEVKELRSREKVLSDDLKKGSTGFIGSSLAMKKVFADIEKVASTDANILILGENGTGKELVARALHDRSLRAAEPFISVDLGAISDSLFESELFGHVKGAFTDAREDRAGRFEIANKGTLFLDEIGNLSLPLQSKLLTVIQNRQVTRVGSNKNIPVNIRLVCATNANIYDMVARNIFRQDLLYRINTVEIHLPPLRERGEDIILLSEHFLELYGRKYNKPKMRFSPTTLKKLEKYHWPGNVRELQHAVERAVIMSDSNIIQPSDFSFSLPDSKGSEKQSINLEEVERNAIKKVISKHGGNISHAARELGLTRAALYRRIEKYGL